MSHFLVAASHHHYRRHRSLQFIHCIAFVATSLQHCFYFEFFRSFGLQPLAIFTFPFILVIVSSLWYLSSLQLSGFLHVSNLVLSSRLSLLFPYVQYPLFLTVYRLDVSRDHLLLSLLSRFYWIFTLHNFLLSLHKIHRPGIPSTDLSLLFQFPSIVLFITTC